MMTDRQKQVLDFIVGQFKENLFFPTFREIAKELGTTSTNGVYCHIEALVRKGFVVRTGPRARWYKLTDKALVMYGLEWAPNVSESQWMVVVKKGIAPVEVVPFDGGRYEGAVQLHRELRKRWGRAFLCRVTKGCLK